MSAATYITSERYASILDLPICLPETELRRGTVVQIASFKLTAGQVAAVRFLNLNVLHVLTPGVVPDAINSAYGWCYAGVFAGHMVASPFIVVASSQVGSTSLNSAEENLVASPGLYTVLVANNTGKLYDFAIDLLVCVTGVIKIYQ
jgi:hypothetical protein